MPLACSLAPEDTLIPPSHLPTPPISATYPKLPSGNKIQNHATGHTTKSPDTLTVPYATCYYNWPLKMYNIIYNMAEGGCGVPPDQCPSGPAWQRYRLLLLTEEAALQPLLSCAIVLARVSIYNKRKLPAWLFCDCFTSLHYSSLLDRSK